MTAIAGDRSGIHFGVAGVMTCLSVLLGIPYLMLGFAVPRLSPSPIILITLGLASGSVLFSLYRSIRMIGRRHSAGWAMLLGNCFYAVVLAPVSTIHGMLVVEAMR